MNQPTPTSRGDVVDSVIAGMLWAADQAAHFSEHGVDSEDRRQAELYDADVQACHAALVVLAGPDVAGQERQYAWSRAASRLGV